MFDVVFRSWPLLLAATGETVLLSVASGLLATLLGILLALGQLFAARALRYLVEVWLYVMRGVPLLVLLFAMYYALPYTGIDLSPRVGGILVLSTYFSAFMAEIFRSAVLAVPKGQWDAARGIGFHGWRLMREVIVPQALRLASASYVNTMIMLVKGTSLVSIIGLWELTLAGRQIVERTLASFQVFGAVALIYFVLCYGLSLAGRYLEKRFSYVH
ncbi:amino acid ABC transporter permease [Enterovirga aerilata]|uniref:Amino acid ABC transporter permease n=1 Tax=Enterovirga aerilata TaxID=2730920 RepID=A0A849I3A7_9HYPH|nr:amino acid ABC transporter permease [Enterovirga sp. DB1703]NNM70869.1 amino acid ABC transporter permease [Enterovirga sp. DB1703]